jgi:hypothetical protein
MNAAEMGTAKPNYNSNVPTTSNNTNSNVPIIIPLPPPTDVFMATENTASENVVNHDPLDSSKTYHQPPDAGTTAEPMNESKTNASAINGNDDVKVDIVEPVIVGNDVTTPLQSLTLPVKPPLSVTDQPQINELD